MNQDNADDMGVIEAELTLLQLYRLAKEQPDLTEADARHIRVAARTVFTRSIRGMNEEWQRQEGLWALICEEARHALSIYKRLLELIASRLGGWPLQQPIQVDGASQTPPVKEAEAEPAIVHESMVVDADVLEQEDDDDVIFVSSDETWADSVFAAMDAIPREAEMRGDIVRGISGLTSQAGVACGDVETAVVNTATTQVGNEHGTVMEEDVGDAEPIRNEADGMGRATAGTANRGQAGPSTDRRREARKPQTARGPRQTCWFCMRSHVIYGCPRFLALSKWDRYMAVGEYGACHNCLQRTHGRDPCDRRNGCFCVQMRCQCGRTHDHNSTICGGRRHRY